MEKEEQTAHWFLTTIQHHFALCAAITAGQLLLLDDSVALGLHKDGSDSPSYWVFYSQIQESNVDHVPILIVFRMTDS